MASKSAQIIAVVFALIFVASAAYAPLFVWSGNNHIKHDYIADIVDFSDVEGLVGGLLTSMPKESIFSDSVNEANSEVVVLFVSESMNTHEAANSVHFLADMKSMMNEANSFVAPFVALDEARIAPFASEVAKTAGRVFYVGDSDHKTYRSISSAVEVSQVTPTTLDKSIFSDRATDVIVVSGSIECKTLTTAMRSDEAVLQQVVESVKQQTDSYVCIVSTLPPTPTFRAARSSQLAADADPNAEWSVADFFPAWFWQGFIFGLAFVLLLIYSVYHLMEMQTPDRFQEPKKFSAVQ